MTLGTLAPRRYTRLVAARIRGRPTVPCTCIANEATGVGLLQAYERDRAAEVSASLCK